MDILWLQEPADASLYNLLRSGDFGLHALGHLGCHETLPVGDNAAKILIVISVRLTGTTAILRLFAAAGHFLTRHQHGLPPVFALQTAEILGHFLVYQKFATFDAHATQNLENHLEELNVVDGTGQTVVSKVAGASVIVEAA
jgi:hypothetical protein